MSEVIANNWSVMLVWAAIIILGYPLITIIVSEASRRVKSESGSDTKRFLGILQYTIMPAAVVWVVLHQLTSLPPDSLALKIIDTVVGILVLYGVLLLLQIALMGIRTRIDGGIQAPKLFYELGSLVIAVVGGALIISSVWNIELGTLFGALGVGSVVLGLALQNVIGGLVSGLIVLSGRHFGIGDWLEVGGTFAKVVQVDWRSVTLDSGGVRLVVPSSTLSSSTLSIRHADQAISVNTSVVASSTYSPEEVKAALLEASAMIEGTIPDSASAVVKGYSGNNIEYSVAVAVDNPSKVSAVRSQLMDRLWYVCNRHGVAIGGANKAAVQNSEADIAKKEQLLIKYASFRREMPGLSDLAALTRIERYAAGEYLQRRNTPVRAMFIVISGNLSLRSGPVSGGMVIERLESGQIFIIRELFRNSSSPIDLVADSECEVLCIPAQALHDLLSKNRKLSSDIGHMIDTRTDLIKTMKAKLQ